MFKRIFLLGSVIMVLGGVLLLWTHYDAVQHTESSPFIASPNDTSKTPSDWPPLDIYGPNGLNQELAQLNNKPEAARILEQQARLKADISKLAVTDNNDPLLKEKLYGENWQNEVHKYKQRGELREIVFTTSIVLTVLGGIIFCACLGLVFVRSVRCLYQKIYPGYQIENEVDDNQQALASSPIQSNPTSSKSKEPIEPQEPVLPTERTQLYTNRNHLGSRSRLAVQHDVERVEMQGEDNPALEYQRIYPSFDDFYFSDCQSHNEALAGLLCDEESLPMSQRQQENTPIFPDPQEDTETDMETAVSVCTETDVKPEGEPEIELESEPEVTEEQDIELEVEPSEAPSTEIDETIATQTDDLAKQIAEVKALAQQSSQASEDAAEPVGDMLHQLSEQISAIRQYAASQQDRVEKLQSGYDWNIIRTFCLRFIRCIDNLETRIGRLQQDAVETDYLRDVRDELLFALESSGVEQYEPDIGSLFRGQERIAEAIKDKESCDDPEQKGRIAAIVKPGYQYVIDEDNVKVVRTARVKLYE